MPDELCPCHFPETISFDCAYQIAMAVRDGSFLDRKSEMTRHAACLLGSIANQFDGVSANDSDRPFFATKEDAAAWVAENCKPETEGVASIPVDILIAAVVAILKEVLPELFNFWS